jgi:broad specificity phosphatase PhoE
MANVDRLRESGVLPEVARWFTSPQRKALQTAERLGHAEAEVIADFREQERPGALLNDFEGIVKQSLLDPSEPPSDGWESAHSTRERVVSAALDLLEDGTPVVLVGHGFAWTLLAAHLTRTEPDFEMWRSISMPDHCCISDGFSVSGWGRWSSMT